MNGLNKKNIIQTAVLPELLPEEIPILVEQFEGLFKKEALTPYSQRRCQICKHPDRKEINAAILGGARETDLIARWGGFHVCFSSHLRHLSFVLRPQAIDALVDMASRIQADMPFPIQGSRHRQMSWIHHQLMVARQIAFDHIDNPFEINWSAFDRYVSTIQRIRETITIVYSKNYFEDKRDINGNMGNDPSQSLDQMLTPDQRKVLKLAKERRALLNLGEVNKRERRKPYVPRPTKPGSREDKRWLVGPSPPRGVPASGSEPGPGDSPAPQSAEKTG